nr:hypothetical protein [Rhizoctonia zeae hypovirus 2]
MLLPTTDLSTPLFSAVRFPAEMRASERLEVLTSKGFGVADEGVLCCFKHNNIKIYPKNHHGPTSIVEPEPYAACRCLVYGSSRQIHTDSFIIARGTTWLPISPSTSHVLISPGRCPGPTHVYIHKGAFKVKANGDGAFPVQRRFNEDRTLEIVADCTNETYKTAQLMVDWLHLWEWERLGNIARFRGVLDFWLVLIGANLSLEESSSVILSMLDVLDQIWHHLPDGDWAQPTPRTVFHREGERTRDMRAEIDKIQAPKRFFNSSIPREDFITYCQAMPQGYAKYPSHTPTMAAFMWPYWVNDISFTGPVKPQVFNGVTIGLTAKQIATFCDAIQVTFRTLHSKANFSNVPNGSYHHVFPKGPAPGRIKINSANSSQWPPGSPP